MTTRRFRIFISSPSDVFAERERVERVITRLNGEFGGTLLEAIRWERSYYTAAKTFQDQIPLPSETDLVICILWKRLGFELPPDYRRPDGTTPTGTEYEFEDAMQAARAKGTPDVLVYRKAAPVLLDAEQVEVERAQFEALKTFWTHWFRSETGHFTAAYQSFETTDSFETAVEDHIRQWLARHKVALAGVTWSIEQRGSPFRGLRSFDVGHADVFFGRHRVVERARERWTDAAKRGTPFLLILGASGSGKSSLARAGLLPRLLRPGSVPGVDLWRSCTFRPSEGDTPFHALAAALYQPAALPELGEGDSPAPTDLAALLAAAPEAAARAVRRALDRVTAAVALREGFDRRVEARLLLVADQFEEALTPPDRRDDFAAAMSALVASGAVWLVATLRSDLYALFQASPILMALRDAGAQVDLLPPTAAELGEIVTGPATAAGLRFDARPDGVTLDEILIADADQPGALPLLQLALDALFEARDPATNLLTFKGYDALGGLPGVVERRAEAALASLDAEAAATLPDLLRILVDVADDGAVTSRAASLRSATETPAEQRLLDAFVAARLLSLEQRGEETSLRVAHDALLSAWPRAAALIERDREMLRIRDRIEAATRRWTAEKRHADYLLPPGRPLAEGADLVAHEPGSLSPDGAAFVSASREADAARIAAMEAHAQRELRLEAEAQTARAEAATRVVRRTRAAAGAVFALLLVAAGAAVFATGQRREAQQQATEAERQSRIAQHNLQAALDGGTNLMDVVTGHLRDGGMTRQVARQLLDAAGGTLGAVGQGDGTSPPIALEDTRSRLQASFSTVQMAVCDSLGAQRRARDAVATAEAASMRAPAPARQVALVQRLGALGAAATGNRDFAAARAAFDRAEAVSASAAPHGPLDAARQSARRDDATLRLVQGDEAFGLRMFREDLAWQEVEARDHPDQTEPAALQALDLRRIANVLLGRGDPAEAQGVLDREAAILRDLAIRQPANLEWQRALAINLRQQSRVASGRGDEASTLTLAQQAADIAGRIAGRDPGNADWQQDLLIASVNLGAMLAKRGDTGAIQRVLAPALAGSRSLTGPEANGLQCRTNAARLHGMAGNALLLSGAYDDAAAEGEVSVALFAEAAAAEPDALPPALELIEAELWTARSYFEGGRFDKAVERDRTGLEAAHRLVSRDPANREAQETMSRVRLHLGDALRRSGDTDGAIEQYRANAAAGAALSAAQPGVGQWQHQAVTSLLQTAEAEAIAKRPDRQRAALEQARAAAQRLTAAFPRELAWQRDLVEVRLASAWAELVGGDATAALSHGREALSLADALAALAPGDTGAQLTRANALTLLGMAYRLSGRADEAQPFLERGEAALRDVRSGRGPAQPP